MWPQYWVRIVFNDIFGILANNLQRLNNSVIKLTSFIVISYAQVLYKDNFFRAALL